MSDLPTPPPGRTGWPWTEPPPTWPPRSIRGERWPRLSLVTPSLNQGRFLEETLRSVLLQGYPELEYIVVDGGSTDDSLAILKRYEPWLHHWDSRPDGGQYEALERGFAQTSGDLMAWLNSDDKYCPTALQRAAEIFVQLPQVEWLTSLQPIRWAERGGRLPCRELPGFSRSAFMHGEYAPGVPRFHSAWIQQESTFWRRDLWQRAGGRLDTSLRLAADFELWSRFYRHAELYGVRAPLGGFRVHPGQQTALHMPVYVSEAARVLERCGGALHGTARALLRAWITRWPALLRRPMTAIGWAHPSQIVDHDRSGSWRLTETAV